MIDKTLDEQVAEALGWEKKIYPDGPDGDNFMYLRSSFFSIDCREIEGFFTNNMNNVMEHVMPALISDGYSNAGITIQYAMGMWIAKGNGLWNTAQTLPIVLCMALLDLKEREAK